MMELCPFLLPRNACRSMWYVYFIPIWPVFSLAGNIDELQYQRSSRDDAAASREKISTDDVLENRGLSRRLRTYNNLPGQLASRTA